MVIDPGTNRGARADERLRADEVVWLITVAADGTPVPTPVWFWWDGTSTSSTRNPTSRSCGIAANPRVAVALRTDELGDEITVVTGDAVVDPSAPSADQLPEYIVKYAALIARLGADPASFAADYAVPVRIAPTKLRQWRAASVA